MNLNFTMTRLQRPSNTYIPEGWIDNNIAAGILNYSLAYESM
jgi:hypothetical protein